MKIGAWLIVAIAYLAVTSVFWVFLPEVAKWMTILAVVPFGFVTAYLYYFIQSTGRKIRRKSKIKKLQVVNERIPAYRYADIFAAIAPLEDKEKSIFVYKKLHQSGLADIWSYDTEDISDLAGDEADSYAHTIGPDKKKQFPEDIIRINEAEQNGEKHRFVIRLKYNAYYRSVFLEVGAADEEAAVAYKKSLTDRALQNSIYRGKSLSINILDRNDTYTEDDSPASLQVFFKELEPVTDDKIILDDKHRTIIQRNVFDFFKHNEALRSAGLSSQKGLLLYGPPGTGKTFTCRYIYSKLEEVTTIFVTGHQMSEIRSINKIAKSLQPALVIVEEADLFFTNRDQNYNATSMGEFMDDLDGLNDEDNLVFVLTTNAADRVESAIRDRPGRINQCLRFDLPDEKARALIFEHYLEKYDIAAVNIPEIAAMTSKVSQAFIKEICLRAVHIGMENADFDFEKLALQTHHFREAFEEVTGQNSRYVNGSLGFR